MYARVSRWNCTLHAHCAIVAHDPIREAGQFPQDLRGAIVEDPTVMRLVAAIGAGLLGGCTFHAHSVSDVRADSGPASEADAPGSVRVDAEPAQLDAPSSFDPTLCPSTYTLSVTSSASRYRVRAADVWWNLRQACDNDAPGMTHLVVYDSVTEAAMLRANVSGAFFVGAVQPRNQGAPAASWWWLTGAPVSNTFWQASQPDDGDGTEDNHENLAIEGGAGLRDFDSITDPSTQALGLCECDGKATESSIAAMIPQDPT